MRVVIWLAFPVAILGFAVLIMIILNWTQGTPFCGSWIRAVLPVCRY